MNRKNLAANADLRHWSHQYHGNARFYIALADHNLAYTPQELEQVKALWRGGEHVADIAIVLRRKEVEIGALIMDLAERGRVDHRPGGAIGDTL